MKYKILLTVLLGISVFGVQTNKTYAEQTEMHNTQEDEVATVYEDEPYASHFFVDDFLEWTFESDQDAIHNVSNVPLATRVKGEKTNSSQSEDAKVMSIAITNRNTSGTPSQGSSDKAVYNFTNWQYVDLMIAWAGSAGEGIIIPPSGDMIDLSHKNGVPIYGTVFFPPEAYGGLESWVGDFLVKDGDRFPVADKMIEMANAYGFDGWFINQETNTSEANATLMKEFLMYFQANSGDLEIVWYDSMVNNGQVYWQGGLNTQNADFFQKDNQVQSDHMFIDFRWSKNSLLASNTNAQNLNRDPYDLYSGIDVQANGVNSYRKPSSIMDGGTPITSLGLYVPDWTLRDGGNYDVSTYWENELDFWTNAIGDPRDTSMPDNTWQGISRYFVEKTPITSLPFVTNFNVGNGDNYYQEGVLVKEGSFNNRSVQDIMPTYKWIIDNEGGNNLKADIDYSNAYNGGSSIKLHGSSVAGTNTEVKLYATQVSLGNNVESKLTFKGNADVSLVLEFEETSGVFTKVSGTSDHETWQTVTYDLSAYAGKTLKTVGISVNSLETSSEFELYLGALSILDDTRFSPSSISEAQVYGYKDYDRVRADLRISWKSDLVDTDSFNIYSVDGDTKNYEGSTSNTAYYLRDQKRSSEVLEYVVVPVGIDGVEAWDKLASFNFSFDDMELPTGDFLTSNSFVKVDDTVTFSAKPSESTESVSWIVEGADDVYLDGTEVSTSFSKPGIYTVHMILKNSTGETTVTKENLMSVYDDSFNVPYENLSLINNGTNVSGQCAASEGAQGALDEDITTKWCDNRNDKPYLAVRMPNVVSVTGFVIDHAGSGGENPEWNTRDYTIEVSDDGNNWTPILEIRGNTQNTTQDSISPVQTQFIRLVLDKAEQTGTTARIYTFKIMGYNTDTLDVYPNAKELSKLRSLYYQTKGLESLSEYESYPAFEVAFNTAKNLLDSNDGVEARSAFDTLTSTYTSLEGDVRAKLDAQINVAQGIDGSKYQRSEYETLVLKIDRIKNEISSYSILEVHAANVELKEAMASLKLKEISSKQKLQNLVNNIESLNKEDYDEASFKVLMEALEKAKVVLNKESSETEILEAITQLENAKAQLKTSMEGALLKLQALIEKVEATDLSLYTQESVSHLNEVLAKVKAELQSRAINSVEDVEALHNELEEAYNGLKLKDSNSGNSDTPNNDSTNNGDETINTETESGKLPATGMSENYLGILILVGGFILYKNRKRFKEN